jgi:synaptobrevin family protein YKT6
MKIYAILIIRKNDPDEINPTESVLENRGSDFIISSAYDLSSFSYFQRSTIKEYIIFFVKLLVQKIPFGKRESIVMKEQCTAHIHVHANGTGAILVCDDEYPQRVAHTILGDILNRSGSQVSEKELQEYITRYQNPENADKLYKIQKELSETITVVQKTIDSVLERGTKLDTLVKQSQDLSISSKLFYEQAKDQNRCCIVS